MSQGPHWSIESLHWLRDTVYREDDSRARTQSGPQTMAGLRNLAIASTTPRWTRRHHHRNTLSQPRHAPTTPTTRTHMMILKRP